MSYENAPATKLLATDCICCGRPLVDATSVELGIGPVCRTKYGFDEEITDATRVKANALVYQAAALASAPGNNTPEILKIAEDLKALGLAILSAKIQERFVAIRLVDGESFVGVFTPYDPGFVNALKSAIPWEGRRWYGRRDGAAKEDQCWRVKQQYKRELLGVLAQTFPGQAAVGGKGVFVVPTPQEFKAQYVK